MGALVVFGLSLVIIVTVTTVLTLKRRSRVRRQRDETPQDRYRREVQHLRPTDDDTWRNRRYGSGGSDSPPSFYP
jgi:hypothetical protein